MKDSKRENSIRRFRILEVMDLVLKINELNECKDPIVHVSFSGQYCICGKETIPAMIKVAYYEHGWICNAVPDMEKWVYMDCEEDVENLIEALLKILAEKEKLLSQ